VVRVVTEELDEEALIGRGRALGAALRAAAAGAADAGWRVTLLLRGPMGAGKTTFTRALAGGLAVLHPGRVTSPTFTLCAVHRGPVALVHVDLFRLAAVGDGDAEVGGDAGMGGEAGFLALGDLEEDLQVHGPRVLVVEWAEKWRTPPADHLAIDLGYAAGGARRSLRVAASGPRSAAVLAAWRAVHR
jgi:tRNA threonylcarbamoyladenosine biosynthesis protein TsaE